MVLAQLVLVALLTVVGGLWKGPLIALSLVLGGIASVIPSAYFARRVFKRVDAREAKAIARQFFVGEAAKLALTVVLVLLFVMFFPVSLPPFFLGFAVAQMGFWLAPLFDKSQNQKV
jgi:ATP synthase protein I